MHPHAPRAVTSPIVMDAQVALGKTALVDVLPAAVSFTAAEVLLAISVVDDPRTNVPLLVVQLSGGPDIVEVKMVTGVVEVVRLKVGVDVPVERDASDEVVLIDDTAVG